jgi:hypothetical protein
MDLCYMLLHCYDIIPITTWDKKQAFRDFVAQLDAAPRLGVQKNHCRISQIGL